MQHLHLLCLTPPQRLVLQRSCPTIFPRVSPMMAQCQTLQGPLLRPRALAVWLLRFLAVLVFQQRVTHRLRVESLKVALRQHMWVTRFPAAPLTNRSHKRRTHLDLARMLVALSLRLLVVMDTQQV